MRYLIPLLALFAGCATTTSGVIQDGPGTYSLVEAGKTGFVSSSDLRIRVLQRAAEHCRTYGRQLEVISTDEKPGGVLGKFPEASIRFRCTGG
jgi:hypothetical protein